MNKSQLQKKEHINQQRSFCAYSRGSLGCTLLTTRPLWEWTSGQNQPRSSGSWTDRRLMQKSLPENAYSRSMASHYSQIQHYRNKSMSWQCDDLVQVRQQGWLKTSHEVTKHSFTADDNIHKAVNYQWVCHEVQIYWKDSEIHLV